MPRVTDGDTRTLMVTIVDPRGDYDEAEATFQAKITIAQYAAQEGVTFDLTTLRRIHRARYADAHAPILNGLTLADPEMPPNLVTHMFTVREAVTRDD